HTTGEHGTDTLHNIELLLFGDGTDGADDGEGEVEDDVDEVEDDVDEGTPGDGEVVIVTPTPGTEPAPGTTPANPAPVDQTPAKPAPVNPAPVNPTPVDPTPANPAPVDQTPANPAPVDPAPVNPAPVNPAPVNPAPVNPTPVNPTPVNPAPVNPAPVNPIPANPAPVDPTPVNPAPVDPTPVNPTPVNPTPEGTAVDTVGGAGAFFIRAIDSLGEQVGEILMADDGAGTVVVDGLEDGETYQTQVAPFGSGGDPLFSEHSVPVTPVIEDERGTLHHDAGVPSAAGGGANDPRAPASAAAPAEGVFGPPAAITMAALAKHFSANPGAGLLILTTGALVVAGGLLTYKRRRFLATVREVLAGEAGTAT
ncbi:MAG: heme peroxidase, partial [Micrococcaceae bacterium]|nr:heme peroxidase [Micrococcaceae bacterium]